MPFRSFWAAYPGGVHLDLASERVFSSAMRRITETSRQLVCNNLELLGETEQERIERLAVRDRERREAVRLQLEELYHKDGRRVPSHRPLGLWPPYRPKAPPGA